MIKARAVLCSVAVLWGARVAAQDVAPETLLQSNALFAQGKREQEAGQTAAACASFAESFRLMPRGGTLLNLGLCREQEGRLSEAWRALRSALTVAQREGREDRIPIAREHIAALERRLSFATLALPHDVDPSLVALRLDGQAIARDEWTGVPLEPGEHVLTAEAVGFEAWSTKLGVGAAPAHLVVPIGPLALRPAPAPEAGHALPPPHYQAYALYPGPVPAYESRPKIDPARHAALLAEQRLAREGWFLEASIGATRSKAGDDFVKTLRAFEYDDTHTNRLNVDAAVGVMLNRRLGLVFHYDRLESRRYAVIDANTHASEQAGSGGRYVYSWHTQAVMAGLRFRQPLASHWVVLFADLSIGLAFTKSLLEYETAAGAGYLAQRDDSRDRSVALRGLLGFQFGFTRHIGVFLAGGYAYAPTLTNLVDETHDGGGPVFLTGLRIHSVKGWW